MAGHSHWAGIKHKKGVADQKRGQLFSKLLNAVAATARPNPEPEFNPRLRAAIEKAKKNKVPQENIERAIQKAAETKNLEELVIEAYGPAGAAFLIEAITDNRNRTVNEIKQLFGAHDGKLAAPGSVRWIFEAPSETKTEWQAKFKQELSSEDRAKAEILIKELEEHPDVQKVNTNI